MTKEDLKDYLVYEAEYSERRVNKMSDYELFDAWLRYNGIIGFTDDIVDMVKCLNLKNMKEKIEKVFYADSEYASKHKLNTCNKVVSQELLDKIEDGCSLETLEEVAKGSDIFKYRTQITIHGLFPELSTRCIGRYVNIVQNKNKSVGIKYNAIDHEKKKRLYKLICDCTEYRITENSTTFHISQWIELDTSSEEAFKAPIKKAVEEIKKIDRSLFFGSVQVYVSRGLFRTYLVKEINIKCFYERNSKQIVEQVCGMSYDKAMEIHNKKVEEERQRQIEWDKRCEENAAKAQREREILKAKLEEFKRTTPPPSGFTITPTYVLQVGDIAAIPRIRIDGTPMWYFWKIMKSFGRIISKICDENGNVNNNKPGRELFNREYEGYIKKAK